MPRIGGQFPHRQFGLARTSTGQRDVANLEPEVAAVLAFHGGSDIHRPGVAMPAYSARELSACLLAQATGVFRLRREHDDGPAEARCLAQYTGQESTEFSSLEVPGVPASGVGVGEGSIGPRARQHEDR